MAQTGTNDFDPIQKYQVLLREFESLTGNIESITRQMEEISHKLSGNWRDTSFTNVPNVSFPFATQHSVNAEQRPSIKNMAESISRWHTLRHELVSAYKTIPQDRRYGFKSRLHRTRKTRFLRFSPVFLRN